MPRQRRNPAATQQQHGNGRRLQKAVLLANMLKKTVKKIDDKPGNDNVVGIPPSSTPQPQLTIKKTRKPRPPATGKAKIWQDTFKEIRRRHPGRPSEAFKEELRRAGENHRRKYSSSNQAQDNQRR